MKTRLYPVELHHVVAQGFQAVARHGDVLHAVAVEREGGVQDIDRADVVEVHQPASAHAEEARRLPHHFRPIAPSGA